jgi:hypothetical protein
MENQAIGAAFTSMIQRSLQQRIVRPRYRIGMVAYTDELYDVYGSDGSIITIDKIAKLGTPTFQPQKSTQKIGKAFRYAAHMIQQDISSWSQEWLDKCPPPNVVNITDCEFGEDGEDPVTYAQELQKILVPDGNVLVTNIFINDRISRVSTNSKEWLGYRSGDSTGDPFGDKLLMMSSEIPLSYLDIMRAQIGVNLHHKALMMFPGVNQDIIKSGMVMSVVTSSPLSSSRSTRPEEWEKTSQTMLEEESSENPSLLILQKQLEARNSNIKDGSSNSVFISYCHADSRFLHRLLIHLRPLEKKGIIDLWADTKLQMGDLWIDQITHALSRARVAVLLITADFMASDFIIDNELPPILKKAEAHGLKIIPVILKACRFERDKNLSRFHAVNNPKTPLISMSINDQEKLYDKIAQAIEMLVSPRE